MRTKEIIKLYEGYKKMLEEHHSEVMELIKKVSDIEGVSTDVEIRDYITELMSRASYLNNCISIVSSKIRRLKDVRKA